MKGTSSSNRSSKGTISRSVIHSVESWMGGAGSVAGAEVAGTEVAGMDVAGTEVVGTEVAGMELAGTEVAGMELAGTEEEGIEERVSGSEEAWLVCC